MATIIIDNTPKPHTTCSSSLLDDTSPVLHVCMLYILHLNMRHQASLLQFVVMDAETHIAFDESVELSKEPEQPVIYEAFKPPPLPPPEISYVERMS